MLNELERLAKLVTPNHLNNIELLSPDGAGKKLYTLYEGLNSGKFRSDEEAAAQLYNTDPSDSRYAKLKNKLTKRLYNYLFLLDNNKSFTSNYSEALVTCEKQLALIKILGLMGEISLAMKSSKRVLKVSQKYGFHAITIECCRTMKRYFTLLGKKGEYFKCDKIEKRATRLLDADQKAEDYYNELVVTAARSKSIQDVALSRAVKHLQELKGLSKELDSYVCYYNQNRLEATILLYQGDFRSPLALYDELEDYMDRNKAYYQEKIIAHLNVYRLNCYLHLNDLEHGKKAAKACLDYFPSGGLNWFIFHEYYFLLAIRTSAYQQAKSIFNTIVFHHKYQTLPPDRKEKWVIYEAYLNFLFAQSKEPDTSSQMRTKRFDREDFLRHVTIFSKDKKGYNVAILIIQILFMLKERNYGGIIDRMDALKVYHNRHLKTEHELRSKLFIKMLLIMETQSFDPDDTKAKTAKYQKQLLDTKFRFEGTPMDAEIIPYEQLWDMVMHLIEA